LTLGKLGLGVLLILFIEKRLAYFPVINGAVKEQLILNEEAAVTSLMVCTYCRCLQVSLTIDWRSAFFVFGV
jgi:hypothetical protein